MNPALPPWLDFAYRRVFASFMTPLSRSHGWKTLFLISPWISDFDGTAGMSFRQFLRRLEHDDATVYVATRPPREEWHENALIELENTGVASIALIEELHTKLYCAMTDNGQMALMGSANLTAKALQNRELGVLIRDYGDGMSVVKQLFQEASEIYRTPSRRLRCKRSFRGGGKWR